MATTSDIKNGTVILHKNKRMKVVEFLHVKPGKGPAFVRTKLKNIQTGKVVDETFNAGVKLEFIRIEAKEMQFLYDDGDQYIFMDNQTYEQLNIDTVLMTVSQTKNIIRTQIQGKSGTIKEYVSDGDFEIDVAGIIVSEGENTYPVEEVEALMQLFSIPDSLRVTSEFLNHFFVASPKGISGIDEVVITDFNFPQQEGIRNSQNFTCKMISDIPIELII